jgi:hypothetical protein
VPRTLLIEFEPGHTHRIRNFGEALYSAFKEDDYALIALEEIDRATTQLHVRVRVNRQVRRISRLIQNLLERHHLVDIAQISEPPGVP